ncbi:MAG: type II secretion system protein, partial [Candidatus Nomurabacteria bacterium]|nr:type II secretion system protein [Candidatus Nomurabacteria bacterium]
GLTLIELMVVISIFLVITTTVIFNYGTFNSNVSLQNLTDDVALSIRKAQGFAIGARAVGDNFRNSYGMHFSVDSSPLGSLSGSNKSFLMFSVPTADTKKYTDNGSMNDVCGNGSNQCIESFNITSADNIKELQIDDVSKVAGSIDIIFTRPNTRAYFCYRANASSDCVTASRVNIVISNGQTGDKERTKTISVQNTGQISIQ